MNIISSNFGDGSIALIQWAKEQGLENISVFYVDTGWAANSWQQQVNKAWGLCKKYGFKQISITAEQSFADLVKAREGFPNQQFQWCAGILKGLCLLTWLDEIDPLCEATILIGKRRLDAKLNERLPEYIAESEHHGDRQLWHPLYNCSDEDFNQLISRAGFAKLGHRSLECDPCVNSSLNDFHRFGEKTIKKVEALEKLIQKPMFINTKFGPEQHIRQQVNWVRKHTQKDPNEESNSGNCGSPFGCGV